MLGRRPSVDQNLVPGLKKSLRRVERALLPQNDESDHNIHAGETKVAQNINHLNTEEIVSQNLNSEAERINTNQVRPRNPRSAQETDDEDEEDETVATQSKVTAATQKSASVTQNSPTSTQSTTKTTQTSPTSTQSTTKTTQNSPTSTQSTTKTTQKPSSTTTKQLSVIEVAMHRFSKNGAYIATPNSVSPSKPTVKMAVPVKVQQPPVFTLPPAMVRATNDNKDKEFKSEFLSFMQNIFPEMENLGYGKYFFI